jgi:hypothetical protein
MYLREYLDLTEEITGEGRKLHNEELHNLTLHNIIKEQLGE